MDILHAINVLIHAARNQRGSLIEVVVDESAMTAILTEADGAYWPATGGDVGRDRFTYNGVVIRSRDYLPPRSLTPARGA